MDIWRKGLRSGGLFRAYKQPASMNRFRGFQAPLAPIGAPYSHNQKRCGSRLNRGVSRIINESLPRWIRRERRSSPPTSSRSAASGLPAERMSTMSSPVARQRWPWSRSPSISRAPTNFSPSALLPTRRFGSPFFRTWYAPLTEVFRCASA